MKTIYYLGDQLDKVWNEGSVAEVEITLTTLGREELTITGFTGDLLEKVYFILLSLMYCKVPSEPSFTCIIIS